MDKTIYFFLLLTALGFSQTQKEYDFSKVAEGMHFPEGPAWDYQGNLYVSSCHGGYITNCRYAEC